MARGVTVTEEQLATYVGLSSVTPFVSWCRAEAIALVNGWILSVVQDEQWAKNLDPYDYVSGWALDRAYLEVGAELFHRKSTKNAVAQFAAPDGTPVRIARDPLVAAYPLLRPFLGGGFA